MIGFVEGRLGETWANSCLVLTDGGTGYRVFLPAHTFSVLPEKGERVAFHTITAVRENAIELYGFETLAERLAFEVLRGINRIGSRTALAILSACRPDELANMIAGDDLAALTRIPGIGKKTAQHILLELKNRLPENAGGSAPAQAFAGSSGLYADVVAALVNLGYSENECAGAVREIVKAEPDLDTGSAIRLALRELGKS